MPPPPRFAHLENGANNNKSYPPAPTQLLCGSHVCPGLGTGPAQRTAIHTTSADPTQTSLVSRAWRNVGTTDPGSAADGIGREVSGPHAPVVMVTTVRPPEPAPSLPQRVGQVRPAPTPGEPGTPQHTASSGRKQMQPVIHHPEPHQQAAHSLPNASPCWRSWWLYHDSSSFISNSSTRFSASISASSPGGSGPHCLGPFPATAPGAPRAPPPSVRPALGRATPPSSRS